MITLVNNYNKSKIRETFPKIVEYCDKLECRVTYVSDKRIWIELDRQWIDKLHYTLDLSIKDQMILVIIVAPADSRAADELRDILHGLDKYCGDQLFVLERPVC